MAEASQTPSDRLASRYAELFVSVFDRIADVPDTPLVAPSASPQCGIEGVAFRGSNAVVASMVASEKGYLVPSWMTLRRANDLGLRIRAGERGIPVVHYDRYYEDVQTRKRDPEMDDARYAALSDEERKRWGRRCYMQYWPEFNVAQTNFAEVYPEQWDALCAEFGAPPVRAECPALDAALLEGVWLCPVRVSEAYSSMAYAENYDEVRCPPKVEYVDEGRFYGDLAYTLARSTGGEGRLDRDINCAELSRAAREELVCELAGATVATLAGAQSTLQDRNLVNLRAWVNAIRENPAVIFSAVNDAAKAADMVSTTLGLERRPGFSLQRMMEGVDAAREAMDRAREAREARAQAVRKAHGKGWNPVKTRGARR